MLTTLIRITILVEFGGRMGCPREIITARVHTRLLLQAGRVPQTLWKYEDVGHTQEAKKDLLKLVSFASSDSVFDTPKPPRLIKQMLRIGTESSADDLIEEIVESKFTSLMRAI